MTLPTGPEGNRPPSEFHERGGWYFTRLRDGSVRIRWSGDGTGRDVVHIIPANSWDSIVQHLRATSSPSSQPASEPSGGNIDQAVAQALKEPTLLDALTYMAVWESERVVKQARANDRWETCFKISFAALMGRWPVPALPDSDTRLKELIADVRDALRVTDDAHGLSSLAEARLLARDREGALLASRPTLREAIDAARRQYEVARQALTEPGLLSRQCEVCGRKLTPCPARWDGEPTYVGYYPCQHGAQK